MVSCPESLNEFYSLRRPYGIGLPRNVSTRRRTEELAQWCTAPLGADVTRTAWLIEDQTGYRFFDCLLIASALHADCGYFLSEDLQHDRRLGGLTIVNPFVTSPFDFFPAT